MPTPILTSHIFPSTAVTTGSGVAWTTPANAVSENATSTTSALTKSATTSQTLRVTGFDFSAIPAGSLITGIEVRIKRSTAGATVTDNSVRLSLSGASIGSNLASATNYPTTLTWATYGGASETWGAGLTDSQVKDSTFGVDISAKLSGTTSRTVSVDAVSVAVAYLAPGIYLEATEARDIASMSVWVPVTTTLAATEAPDTASFAATVPTLTVSYVGTGATHSVQNSGSGSVLNPALPSGWQIDDIFIMQITVDGGSGSQTISGWTNIASLGNTWVFWRRAASGDTGPSFLTSPSYMNYGAASISAWRNAQTSGSPIDSAVVAAVSVPSGGAAATPPAVTVSSTGSYVFSTTCYSSGTIAFASPLTTVHQINQSFSTGATAGRSATVTGPQSVGTFSATFPGSYNTVSFVLLPAPDLTPAAATITLAATETADTAAFSLTSGGSGVNKGFVRNGATWVEPSYVYAKQGGVWKFANEYLKDGGTWKLMRAAPLPLDITNNASLTVPSETAFSRTFGVSNPVGTASMTISVIPGDPGLSWNSGTFTLSGSVPDYLSGNYTYELTASDSAGRTVVESFYLTVESSGPPEI